MGGGDQPPFRADGGAASSSEAVDAAVELRVGEDRLDDRLALAVELAAALAGEDPAHERVKAAVPTRAGPLSALGVRRDQHRDSAVDDVLHLLLMPVAGVGEQHLRDLGDAGGVQFALSGVEHRFQVPEVRRDGHHLGGDHDLVLVGDGLRVVALQKPAAARALDDVRVRVGEVDLALRCRGGRVRVRRSAEAAPVFHPPRPVALVGAVRAHLGPQLLIEAPLGFLETLAAATRNRPRLLGAMLLQLALGLAQPRPPFPGAQLLGQLVAARLAVKLVLGGVDRLGFFEDLARELLVIDIRVAARVARQLRPVDGNHADAREALLRAQRQHLAEQARDRLLVTLDEPRDRRVIGPLLRRQHAERDILLAAALDRARGPRPACVGVEQQRHHHRRVIRWPTAAVETIGRIERVQLHLADGVDDEPREVVPRQPIPHIRRHQKRLITITRDEALSHHQMVLNAPDSTPTYATASPQSRSAYSWSTLT